MAAALNDADFKVSADKVANAPAPAAVKGAAAPLDVERGPPSSSDLDDPLRRMDSTASVYSVHSERRKFGTLGLMAIANSLVPLCDTIYLPALVAIEKDLNTNATATAASVAIYLFTVGVAALFWGPIADRWGRRITLLLASAMFVGFSVACVFSPNIQLLITFRALQGAAVAAYSLANAVVADTFPPEERGKAMGLLSIPLLVGPILGPLIGGGLSYRMGWRSTFAAIAILGGVVGLMLAVFLKETHHYHTLRRIQRSAPDMRQFSFKEPISKPKLEAPHTPLLHLLDPVVLPSVLATVVCFGVMFSSLIVLPIRLARRPYRLNEAQIGAASVAGGLGSFLTAPAGGILADWASRRWPAHPTGRMFVGLPFGLVFFPLGVVLYAWMLQFKMHLALVLFATFVLGAALAFIMPATFALVSIVKQQNAAAAGAGINSLMFILSGVTVLVTPKGMQAMKLGPFATMLGGIGLFFILLALLTSLHNVRRAADAIKSGEDGSGAGKAGTDDASGDAPKVVAA